MSRNKSFEPNEFNITDEDIRWAANILGLTEDAFHGKNGNDPRIDVLKSMETIDVEACPGSGKTTLLVAKLAILAKKWKYRTQGICVLSHTNAARIEIEKRLGNTAIGRQLLSYPHFIGTIHGFVDTFLALPWLRSNGYSGIQFNTEISRKKLWKESEYGKSIPTYIYNISKNSKIKPKELITNVHYVGEDLDLRLKSNKILRRKKNSTAFNTIDNWKKSVLKEGYAAYEDTFAFGHKALSEYIKLSKILRDRFPILFIDEVQDTNEEQSKILYRIFMDGEHAVIRQRFGDSNQAIYNSFSNNKGVQTDPFPSQDKGIKRTIPNSYRFGPNIAKIAAPLRVSPYEGGLVGEGPPPICPEFPKQDKTRKDLQPILFLFDGDQITEVLQVYAELLIKKFTKEELKCGTFTAVGMVHKNKESENKNTPYTVGDYWPNYDPELSRSDPRPQTFVQYLYAARNEFLTTGETHPGVEKIAQGFLRLAGMAKEGRSVQAHRRCHRYILELLEEENKELNLYHRLINQVILERKPLTHEDWGNWVTDVKTISKRISGVPIETKEAEEFLKWKDVGTSASGEQNSKYPDNIYPYKEVFIRLGSIHSVKGQTHTATLILDTSWKPTKKRQTNLESIKKWLLGSNEEPEKNNATRLKVHYVAMTRPTHLLCLAMKKDSFAPDERQKLKNLGWDIRDV